MLKYSGTNDEEIGFIFAITPTITLLRPFICSRADLHQSHKKLLIVSYLTTSLAYLPFILLPYLLQNPSISDILTERIRFWGLLSAHFIGSLGFCGVRSLGDSLAVNYAMRVGEDYGIYRKYGSVSFGLFGYLLGHVNQNWIMPDFTPSFVVYSLSMSILAFTVYLCPDEIFAMKAHSLNDEGKKESLPNGRQIISHMGSKLKKTLSCSSIKRNPTSSARDDVSIESKRFTLSNRQQISIFTLLLLRDYRVIMYLLVLTLGGLTGYSAQSFIFTFANQYCGERAICDGASMTGLMMMCYCICETTCYLLINAIKKRIGYLVLLETSLLCVAMHYTSYFIFLDKVSAYLFLLETLHGLEYSCSLISSVELGHKFANEVELLLPELMERGVISEDDDLEIVKVCLLATLNSVFTMVYDGIGCATGCLIYAFVIKSYSFKAVFLVIGTVAGSTFILVFIGWFIGKCLNMKPQICQLNRAPEASVARRSLKI